MPPFNKSTFFNAEEKSSKHKAAHARQIIDVGGNGDCAFRSVAAGILDHLHSSRFSGNSALNKVIGKITKLLFQYYPQYKSTQPYATHVDRFQTLMRQVLAPELVGLLAYVLRQIAVGNMAQHPEIYKGAFVEKHEGTSVEQMRKAGTWVDECAIAALADALDISIQVSVSREHRELPLTLNYNKSEKNSLKPFVEIELKDHHYRPRVKNVRYFKSLSQRKAREIEAKNIEHNDPELADILKKIASDNQRMAESFRQTKKALDYAYETGDIGVDELLELYVSAIGSSDYLQGRIKYIGLNLGNQSFFDNLINKHLSEKDETEKSKLTYKDELPRELIHALARAVSIEQIQEDKLFASIEEHKNVLKVG